MVSFFIKRKFFFGATALIALLLFFGFQNCSQPDASKITKLSSNNSEDDTNSNEYSNLDASNNSASFPMLPRASDVSSAAEVGAPKFYAFIANSSGNGGLAVTDVCLSDNNYIFKLRNLGSNPKLCMTPHSNTSGCTKHLDKFVTLTQANYQLVSGDWIQSGTAAAMRAAVSLVQAPLKLDVFYIDDIKVTPGVPIGTLTVHACANKIDFNPMTFDCPSSDPCGTYYPGTVMEPGSCILKPGGANLQCLPTYVEPGDPRSGTFTKYAEPAVSTASTGGGSAQTSTTPVQTPPASGNTGANRTTSSSCGTTPSGTSIISWPGYQNAGNTISTRTIVQGRSNAYMFTADSTRFPNGSTVQTEVPTDMGGSNRADIVISNCPGVFTSTQSRCSFKNIKIGNFLTTFNVTETDSCILKNGEVYYVNIRPATGYTEVAKFLGSQSR